MRAAWATAALALVAGGCLRSTAYTCETDGDCVFQGQGVCEDVGYCSFADDGCASGRRFGEGAGPYADQCVAVAVDAAVADAPVDAPVDALVDAPVDAPVDAQVDAPVDAPVDAAPTVGCLDPGNGTTFPMGSPCNGWGTPFGSAATVQQTGGRLTVTLNAGVVSIGGCAHAAIPFAAPGALVEVERVVDGANARTRLELEGSGFSIGTEGTMIVARAGGAVVASAAYSPVAMRWWRLRPAAGGVVFETSPDAQTWIRLGSSALAPPASAPLRVLAETVAGEPAPGSARFPSANLCP
jgi:hypothetical protein